MLVPEVQVDDALPGENPGGIAQANVLIEGTDLHPEDGVRMSRELEDVMARAQPVVDAEDEPSQTARHRIAAKSAR